MRVEQQCCKFPWNMYSKERVVLLMWVVVKHFESSQIPRLRTDCTVWIRSEQMTTDLEESSGARDRRSTTLPQFCWSSIGDDCWTSSYWWRPHSSKCWQKGIQFGLASSDHRPAYHRHTYGIGVHVPEWSSQVQPCTLRKGMGPERSLGALRMS